MSTSRVKSADRVLTILDFLATRQRPVPCVVIARGCGLPRSSTYHLLNVLMARGFVSYYEAERRWGLGAAVLPIAAAYRSTRPLTWIARPHLKAFVAGRGQECALVALEGDASVVLLEQAPDDEEAHPPRRRIDVEARRSAAGRALLMGLGPAALHEVVVEERRRPGPRPRVADLAERLAPERRRGWTSEWLPGERIFEVGVPVFDDLGRTVAALRTHVAPDHRHEPDRAVVDELRAAAHGITHELRHLPAAAAELDAA